MSTLVLIDHTWMRVGINGVYMMVQSTQEIGEPVSEEREGDGE